MQFHSFEITEQSRLKLVTEHAESLLRKAENSTPVINIKEAAGRKDAPRVATSMPQQPEAYMKPNKYDFF
ncbi:MAG: hypothetical protein ACTHMM_06685 [Agriterribacter sp.]